MYTDTDTYNEYKKDKEIYYLVEKNGQVPKNEKS